jgi:hypothetical protein
VELNELTPGKMVATPRGELLKVRGIKYNRLATEVLYPPQRQTTIREFGLDAARQMAEPSQALLDKYSSVADQRRSRRTR